MKQTKQLIGLLLSLSGLCLSSCANSPDTSSSQSSLDTSSLSEEPSINEASSEASSTAEESSSSDDTSLEAANTFTVHFETGDENVLVEDIEVEENKTISKPYPNREGYAIRRWLLNGVEFDFNTPITESITLEAEWVERTNLPTMIVELRDTSGDVFPIDSLTREDYVSSTISLVNGDGQFDQKDTASSFKGRGNGSWMDAKKGFKIKFNKKQSLFGREANKHWVLLACTNFSDGTMLRNFTAYNMAGELFSNLEYTTNAVWLDLFVNGEYRGVYVLAEHVRVGKGRVDIESKYGIEDTGYLIEYDAYAKGTEGIDYFDITDSSSQEGQPEDSGSGGGFPFPRNMSRITRDGGGGGQPFNPGGGGEPFNPGGGGDPFNPGGGGFDPGDVDISTKPHDGIVRYNFTVHSPDPEEYVSDGKITEEQYRAQVAYIKDYVKRVYTAAITDQDLETFESFADLDSLIDLYILNELYKNTDAGYSSFYLYKKPGGKLFFGPAWDFDGTTTAARNDENNPNGIYVAGTARDNGSTTWSELFYSLYQIDEFKELVKQRYQQLNAGIADYYDNLFTEEFYDENKAALGKNFVRWNSNSSFPGGPQSNDSQERAENDWISNCRTLYDWFSRRITFLNNEWREN